MIIRGEWKIYPASLRHQSIVWGNWSDLTKTNRVSTGSLDMLFADCTLLVLIDDQLDINIFFFQASEKAGILNPRIWLAKHSHVTSLAFYDTAHGPDFFPVVAIKTAR